MNTVDHRRSGHIYTDAGLDIAPLLVEFDRAVAYTDSLWDDLTADEVHWRPNDNSSAIGWPMGAMRVSTRRRG